MRNWQSISSSKKFKLRKKTMEYSSLRSLKIASSKRSTAASPTTTGSTSQKPFSISSTNYAAKTKSSSILTPGASPRTDKDNSKSLMLNSLRTREATNNYHKITIFSSISVKNSISIDPQNYWTNIVSARSIIHPICSLMQSL